MTTKKILDHTLFITCRLCLDDLGIYQIVPVVKKQIQFCFDINVEPFDGMPQLICSKCEKILNMYYETKKNYMAKQLELKVKISGSNAIAQAPKSVTVTRAAENNVDLTSGKIVSTSVVSPSVVSQSSWSKKYIKNFHCKFCNKSYTAHKYLLVHLAKHKGVKAKFRTIFQNHCQVNLKKLDGKTNFTGADDKVVYDKNKIIESHNADHFIIYSKKGDHGKSSSNKNKCTFLDIRYDSSDSNEDVFLQKRNAKRRRINSNSSTDTVVLDKERDCVSKVVTITDSEDNDEDPQKSSDYNTKNESSDVDIQDDGAIHKIVMLCSTKYIACKSRNTLSEASMVQLKKKILSVGRKIINTKDFNSTPFTRFLQYRNLNIIWIQNAGKNVDKNPVKIMPKCESDKSDSDIMNETGWIDYCRSRNITQYSDEQYSYECSDDDDDDEPIDVDSIIENNIHVIHDEINVTDNSDSAVLCSVLANDTQKLLNANPVANPKQLPKKSPNSDKIITKDNSVSETDICMPIITSTTTLVEKEVVPEPPRIKVKPVSELLSKESMNRLIDASKNTSMVTQNNNVVSNVSNIFIIPSMPMAVPGVNVNFSTLPNNNIVTAHNSIVTSNNSTVTANNSIVTGNNSIVTANNSIVTANNIIVTANNSLATSNNSMIRTSRHVDNLLMDTAELPNTRTDSPFNYLKNLLQMHNIFLMNTDAILTENYHCLIKFKVLYKQESKEPVMLCLSLHCHKNIFCLKVKDRNIEEIHISKISANWQWEIIKIFKGDVVNKLLNNAMKVSQETFEYTNSFLCLIKSIKCFP